MAGGFYPFPRTGSPTGQRLAKIADDLRALLATRGDEYSRGAMPAAWQNDQFDNAASDGGYEARLDLALELIESALEPVADAAQASRLKE